MGWQFDAEFADRLKLSMTTLVIGCFFLSIMLTGGTVLATRIWLNWSGWH